MCVASSLTCKFYILQEHKVLINWPQKLNVIEVNKMKKHQQLGRMKNIMMKAKFGFLTNTLYELYLKYDQFCLSGSQWLIYPLSQCAELSEKTALLAGMQIKRTKVHRSKCIIAHLLYWRNRLRVATATALVILTTARSLVIGHQMGAK